MTRLSFKKQAKFYTNLAVAGVLVCMIGLCMVGCSIALGKDIVQRTAEHYEEEITSLCLAYDI